MRPAAALLLLAGCAAEDPGGTGPTGPVPYVPPGEHGPFEAGVTTLEFTDERGKELKVEVWYPAAPEPGDEPDAYEEITITRDAYRGAPPDRRGAPYPVVAFSHGLGGIRYQSAFLTEHLATHGFVVVAPDHTGSVLFSLDEDHLGENLLERPDDVRNAVDHVRELSARGDRLLGGLAADGEYGMVGHSFGAVTTLVLAGGELDYAGLVEACVGRDGIACDYLENVEPDDVGEHGGADDRITVAVAMSPAAAYAFHADGSGLAGTVEMLELAGDRDEILPYEEEGRPVYDALGTPKHLGVIANAGHFGPFSDLCYLFDFYYDCADGYLSEQRGQAIVTPLVTGLLGSRLKGEERDTAPLQPDVLAAIPELTWEEALE